MSHKHTDSQSKTSINPLVKGICILSTAFIFTAAPLYIADTVSKDVAVSASVNGVEIGLVSSADVLTNAYSRVKKTALEIYDGASLPEFNITYDLEFTSSPEYLTEDDCYGYLWSQISDQFCEAYMLYVDNKQVGANQSEDEIKNVIASIEAQLIESLPDQYSSVTISSLIRIDKENCHKSELLSAEDINELLNPLLCQAIPTVSTEDEISHREPSLTVSSPTTRSADGSSDLALDYTLVSSAVFIEEIPFETQYIDDPDNYIGTETVMCEGENGSKAITYELTYDDNGNLISKTKISEDVVTKPVTKVVLVGCTEEPITAPTGSFVWPCQAPKGVSSYYGWRDLYGKQDFHLGIDIPDKKGALIWAADGGKVKFAGYTYSYGYNVIIEHDDGLSTLYAHLNSISVSKGDLVYQGQPIGTMGTTGVAYGSHLHFEIRINNKTVDPMSYLQ